jgi:hypothetical protein
VRLDHLLLRSDLCSRHVRVIEDTVSQLRSCSNARRGTAKSSEPSSRRSTGMQRRVGPMPVRRRRRRHTSGQWESAQLPAPSRRPVPRPSSSDADKSLHASGVKARRRALRGRRYPARPVVRRPCACANDAHAQPRAFSSVGESARLITVRSLVRIQKGPRLPHSDGHPGRCLGA